MTHKFCPIFHTAPRLCRLIFVIFAAVFTALPVTAFDGNSGWPRPITKWQSLTSFRIDAILQTEPNPPFAPDDLLDLIGFYEGGKAGYDAVVLSAKVRPQKPVSKMSLGEIRNWIKATPGQNHAVGRYQIIPKTLDRLMREMRIKNNAIVSPALQDNIANHLLNDVGLRQRKSKDMETPDFATRKLVISVFGFGQRSKPPHPKTSYRLKQNSPFPNSFSILSHYS